MKNKWVSAATPGGTSGTKSKTPAPRQPDVNMHTGAIMDKTGIRSSSSSRVQDLRTPEQRAHSRAYQADPYHMKPPKGSAMGPEWLQGGDRRTPAARQETARTQPPGGGMLTAPRAPLDLYPLQPGTQGKFQEGGGGLSPRSAARATTGASGIAASYGVNTASHPARRVAR